MRPSTLLLLTSAALAAAGGYWVQYSREQTQLRLRMLEARLEPLGQIDYQRLQTWPWGRGRVEQLRLRLSAPAAAQLGLAAGDSLSADRVELLDYRERDPQTPELLRLRWSGLHWPLQAAPRTDWWPLQLAQLREAGLDPLIVDGEMTLRYLPDERRLELQLSARSAALAAVDTELSLRSDPEWLQGQWQSVELSRLRFDYRDQGLASRLEASPTRRSQQDLTTPESSLANRFVRFSQEQGLRWGDGDYQRLLDFLSEPMALRIQLQPPGRLQLRNLPLYATADLPQVLGLSLSPPP